MQSKQKEQKEQKAKILFFTDTLKEAEKFDIDIEDFTDDITVMGSLRTLKHTASEALDRLVYGNTKLFTGQGYDTVIVYGLYKEPFLLNIQKPTSS